MQLNALCPMPILHIEQSMILVCACQGQRTQAQMQRLEALQSKQQAVLRRKTQEAEAARKRLKVPPRARRLCQRTSLSPALPGHGHMASESA